MDNIVDIQQFSKLYGNVEKDLYERFDKFYTHLENADRPTQIVACVVGIVWALKMVHEKIIPGIPLGWIGPAQFQVEAKNWFYASAGLLYFKILTTLVFTRVATEGSDFLIITIFCALLTFLYALLVLPPGTGRITRHTKPQTPAEHQKKTQ